MAKEELIKQLTIKEKRTTDLEMESIQVRQEFAKAFNWYKPQEQATYAGSKRELQNPTWAEIFVQVGKELARLKIHDMEGNILELEQAVQRIGETLIILQNKQQINEKQKTKNN